MALMFQRLAHNYAKNGYYPTDSGTTQGIINAVQACEAGTIRVLDPCCGEGTLLAECSHALGENALAYGIEYNEKRAWHAKSLDVIHACIHGDINDCALGMRSYSYLLLNPPYGDTMSDKHDYTTKRDRLEKLFYRKTNGLLMIGGIMALIIPSYCLDKEFSTWIARHFEQVKVFKASVDQFKQIVIFGVKKLAADTNTPLRQYLINIGSSEIVPEALPDDKWSEPYIAPSVKQQDVKFHCIKVDKKQLADVIATEPASMWRHMGMIFHYSEIKHRRPLRALSGWHLSLALTAGQISGVVKSKNGLVYVIKGDTYKAKTLKEEVIYDAEGVVDGVKRIHTDRFIPVIRALDFTPMSETFGHCLVIQ